jgi:hypothetical protein
MRDADEVRKALDETRTVVVEQVIAEQNGLHFDDALADIAQEVYEPINLSVDPSLRLDDTFIATLDPALSYV